MFQRNAWYIAGWAHELTNKPLARTLLNEPVVLFRDKEGRPAALEDRCCHRGAALSLGEMVENGLMCGYHGLVFDHTGKCVEVPGQSRIPERARVRSYPLVEKNEFAWIWMGDAEKADPGKIVDYPYNDDYANWPHKHAIMPVKCNYRLLVDNLMDLTHLGYVHRKTIGGNPKAHVEAKMKVGRARNGVQYTRWMLNSTPPPTYVAACGFKGKVDRWQEFEYYAPSNILQFSGATDAGTGAYEGKRDGGFALRIFHGITPETDSSCFYFWTAANGYSQSDPKATEQLHEQIAFTFEEDKIFVEEQQRRLEGYDESRLVDIDSDGARMQMRRYLDKAIADEETKLPQVAAE
jgi:vanillate O-demethylase monooxygenase subunit